MGMKDYLGKHVSSMLCHEPFSNWPFKRSVNNDDEQVFIDYTFASNGLEVRCDDDESVRTIFMYADEYGGFDESQLDFSFAFTRDVVLSHLGTPSRSKENFIDPILGEYGASDRFDYADPDFSAHFEYRLDGKGISKYTLMRGDVVPGYRS